MIEPLLITLLKIVAILALVMLLVLYLILAERKIMGYMQGRVGPNRVGPLGMLQTLADGIKFLHKEIIIPVQSDYLLFMMAPMISLICAFTVWSVVPIALDWVLADIDVGVLFVLALTSLGSYGILLGGWASNSKYAFFGAMRSMAQMISYEIALGFSLVPVLLLAGSMNLTDIVLGQQGGLFCWYFLPLFPVFIVFLIAALAETNRAPFDITEGESEIVAGYQVEYSGFIFAMFFIAEYANMIFVSTMASLFFLGGWLSPVEGVSWFSEVPFSVPPPVWLLLKVFFFLYMFIWVRATFPRYRYDQLMMVGWKVCIPISVIWIVVVSLMVMGGLL
ncbi:MAG: NADH-quinone oxidoreductase subunit NuoH [Legionellales bacterium]|nr:NADH-quinone oxidoreductase subunit NuoH [Legionellales bacterium]